MKLRIFLPIIFAIAGTTLLAQPKITSLTYDGDIATLTRNTPPPGIVYYWQGSSCGTLTTNDNLTYLASTSSTFYLREFISSDGVWAETCVSTVVFFPDVLPPVLSGVTTGPINAGSGVSATSNENGMIYLVLEGTPANLTAINTDKVDEAAATAYTPVSLSTSGIGLGLFKVYAVDESDNISVASDYIEVADMTPPVLSNVTSGTVDQGDNILATSNENGVIYLVPDGTAASIGAINAAKVTEAAAIANSPVSLSTTGIASGSYLVYAIDGYDNISTASSTILVADLTAPVLSGVTTGSVEAGTDIQATSNEDGMIYLVPGSTAATLATITTAQVAQIASTSNVPVTLSTTGLSVGDYVVYAVDGSDNVSAASAVITVTAATSIDPNSVQSDQVVLYPTNVIDFLHIQSKMEVSSVLVYSIQGAQMIGLHKPTDRIDMSGLSSGVYIVSIEFKDSSVFTAKVTKR